MPRKWLFVLPNLFTVSSIFCGVYAITQASSGSCVTGDAANLYFYRAAIAILFGMFFDACDGRVARLTKTATEFGVQLDSLADVVTFGAAPAVLVYEWALAPWGFVGVLIAGAFASCGALRLARFNVMASRDTGPSNRFVGLPIPLAAGMIVAVVVAVTQAPQALPPVTPLPIALLTLFLSYLMVSTVKYHSFKKMRVHARELLLFGLILITGALIAARAGANYLLLTYFSAYILVGLVESAVLRRRSRRSAMASAHPHVKALLEDEDEEEDEEDDELDE